MTVTVTFEGESHADIVDQVKTWLTTVEEPDRLSAAEAIEHGVVIARDYPFMCSSLGQELIERDISELGLERVVVAVDDVEVEELGVEERRRAGARHDRSARGRR